MKTQRISALALALTALHLLPASVAAQSLLDYGSTQTTHPFAEATAPLVSQRSLEPSVGQGFMANAVIPQSERLMSTAEVNIPWSLYQLKNINRFLYGGPSYYHVQDYKTWMHPNVKAAWASGYLGQGQNITVVDQFIPTNIPPVRPITGNLPGLTLPGFNLTLLHGQWTALQAGMIAPLATVRQHDANYNNNPLWLYSGLNVINMSYGIMTDRNVPSLILASSPREASIFHYATLGKAIAVKSAGNYAINMGSVNADGKVDKLASLLRDTQSSIFVGALSTNGSPETKASMAWYSNKAGNDPLYQNRFLVVGVDTALGNIAGTSFAAPIVSGYAAILGSKFTTATPTQITNRLLNTARTDTVTNYRREVYGRGEASLSRALSPTSIN